MSVFDRIANSKRNAGAIAFPNIPAKCQYQQFNGRKLDGTAGWFGKNGFQGLAVLAVHQNMLAMAVATSKQFMIACCQCLPATIIQILSEVMANSRLQS